MVFAAGRDYLPVVPTVLLVTHPSELHHRISRRSLDSNLPPAAH